MLPKQTAALAELVAMDLQTANAWRIKEILRWVRRVGSLRAASWRLTWFVNMARPLIDGADLLKPVRKALATIEKHKNAILARWNSGRSNARIEALNGIFQAAKRRARGYRNDHTFISIVHLIAAPIQNILNSMKRRRAINFL